MDGNLTILETIDKVAVGDIRTKIRDILGAFLFSGEDVDKKVRVLSGGERSRLSLAQLLLQSYNLLVLDEPTNHLDMRSKDILKNALKEYDGTLILVSHDREFLDGLVNKVYEFKDHKIKEYLGGIYDFLQKKKIDSFRELERKEESVEITKSVKNSDNKVQYEKRKEQDKIIRKVKSELEKLESKIENVEDEIKKVSDLLVDPEKISDKELFNLYEKYRSEHDKLLNRWEQLNIDLEKLIGNRI
jgi:ATP-binding cassette subfamily F protein 3